MADLSKTRFLQLTLNLKGLKKLEKTDLDSFLTGIQRQGRLKVYSPDGKAMTPDGVTVTALPEEADTATVRVSFFSKQLVNDGRPYQYQLEDPVFGVRGVGGVFAGPLSGYRLGTATETVTLISPDSGKYVELTIEIEECDNEAKKAFWDLCQGLVKIFYKGSPVTVPTITAKDRISDDDLKRRIWFGVPQKTAAATDYSWKIQPLQSDKFQVKAKAASGAFHAPIGADAKVLAQAEVPATLVPPATGGSAGLTIILKCGDDTKAKAALEQVFKWGIATVLDKDGKAIQQGPSTLKATRSDASVKVILPTDGLPLSQDRTYKVRLKNSNLNLDRLMTITEGKPLIVNLNDKKFAKSVAVKGTLEGAKAGTAVSAEQKFLPQHGLDFGFDPHPRATNATVNDKGQFSMPATFLTYDSSERSSIHFAASGKDYYITPSKDATLLEVVLKADGTATAKNGVVQEYKGQEPAVDGAKAAAPVEEPEPDYTSNEPMTPERYAREQDAILKKLPIVKGFYSKAEANISLSNPKSHKPNADRERLPISDFRWAVRQAQNPIYGFASVLYDYLAYGTTVVMGNFVVNVGDYNAVPRAISNSTPFGHHVGETFDITIYVGDDQFHRGLKEWYVQSIHILGARLEEMGNSKELSGEADVVMYAFVARDVKFGVAKREGDTYERPTAEQLAASNQAANQATAQEGAKDQVTATGPDGKQITVPKTYVAPGENLTSAQAPKEVEQPFIIKGAPPNTKVYLDLNQEGVETLAGYDAVDYDPKRMQSTLALVEGATYTLTPSVGPLNGNGYDDRRELKRITFTVKSVNGAVQPVDVIIE